MKLKNMKLRLVTVVMILHLLPVLVLAQWSVGIKTGFNSAKQRSYVEGDLLSTGEEVYGLETQLVGQRVLGKGFELRADFGYIRKGSQINDMLKLTIDELELAVLVNYRYQFNKFSIYANTGGFIGYALNARLLNIPFDQTNDLEFDEDRNREDYGILVGGGLAYKIGQGELFLEGRYRYSIGLFLDEPSIQGEGAISSRNFASGLNLGYMLPLGTIGE